MLKIYNLKEKTEYIEEVATLEYMEWAHDKELNQDTRIKDKIRKIKDNLSKDNFCKLILLDDKELIGFISIFPNDSEKYDNLTPWYATMYVKKSHRKHGYSKILNDAILKEARARGYDKIYLKTDLENYYEKFGAKYIEDIDEKEKLYYFDLKEGEMLNYYLELLDYKNIPEKLSKYLSVPTLKRLKNIGYFCGMDYASKDIYDFKEHISRFDHSLTTALITYKLTKDLTMTLAGLFHDAGTPCFSHVIDYMNHDYEIQESTEEYTGHMIKLDTVLLKYLKEDNIDVEDIINFKKHTVVDNNRPKLCADRLDGIILMGYAWSKDLSLEDIKTILDDTALYKNEFGEKEIGFKHESTKELVTRVNENISICCHSKEDNFMMDLLSKIARALIDKNFITYDDLYIMDETEIYNILEKIEDDEIASLFYTFKNVKRSQIPDITLPKTKSRNINPLVDGKR